MSSPYYETWKFTSGPARGSPLGICMNGCKNRCSNDYYAQLLIKRAEKGTKFTVYDNSKRNSDNDYATIEVLKNINGQKTDKRVGEHNGILVDGFERSRTTEYYKVTYHRKNGSLNYEVSSIIVSFPHRDNGR